MQFIIRNFFWKKSYRKTTAYEEDLTPSLRFLNKIRYILARKINEYWDKRDYYMLDPQQGKTDLASNPRYNILKHLWIPFKNDVPTGRLTWLLYYSTKKKEYKIIYSKLSAFKRLSGMKKEEDWINTHWLDYA